MKPATIRLLWMIVAVALLAIILIRTRSDPPEKGDAVTGEASTVSNRKPISRPKDRTDLGMSIGTAASALRDAESAEDSATILSKLAATLRAGDPEEVSSAVRAFFASGDDVSTGMPFVVAADGRLNSWPTLRAFLLEWLPSSDPEAALALSREVMDRMTSPEEYAIALRNLGWSDLDGDLATEFGERFDRMLRSDAWRAQPAPAFLEAMDAALLLPPSLGARRMAEITADPNTPPALARSGFIALDRIVERNPAVLVDLDAALLGPDQRASLMARLDLANADQHKRFSTYLSSLPEGEELDYFASLFPNGNHLQGNRLFSTPTKPPSIAERREKDLRALTEISAMDFPPDSPAAKAVGQITKRINQWVSEQK
jgi:hypothetical protein